MTENIEALGGNMAFVIRKPAVLVSPMKSSIKRCMGYASDNKFLVCSKYIGYEMRRLVEDNDVLSSRTNDRVMTYLNDAYMCANRCDRDGLIVALNNARIASKYSEYLMRHRMTSTGDIGDLATLPNCILHKIGNMLV